MAANILSDLFDSRPELEQFLDEYRRQAPPPPERNHSLARLTVERFIEEQQWQSEDTLANFDNFALLLGLLLALFMLLPVLYNYFYKFDQYSLMLDRTGRYAIADDAEHIELSTFKSRLQVASSSLQ